MLPLERCLAKSDSPGVPGMNVIDHTTLVGKVAQEILRFIRSQYPVFYASTIGLISNAESIVPLIVAYHDIGKANPLFQFKIWSNIIGENKAWEMLSGGIFKQIADFEEGDYRHQVVSGIHILMLDSKSRVLAGILDRHHGFNSDKKAPKRGELCYFGTEESEWFAERNRLMSILYEYFTNEKKEASVIAKEISSALDGLSNQKWLVKIISGLLCVADWIGSAIDQERLDKAKSINPKDPFLQLVSEGLSNSGLIGFNIKNQLDFNAMFGTVDQSFEPNPVQEAMIQAVIENGAGNIYVLQAPMGVGKTEAALFAAHWLLANDGATGIYFGMPTQVTSNKIHERVDQFLPRIVDATGHSSAHLCHSNASIVDKPMGSDAMPGRSFSDNSKRRLLTPFAVGTIDQVLLSCLKAKHNFVRFYGLAGKVIILDEVHSYDCYTSAVMKKTIEDLISAKCTVIILSATLTNTYAGELLKIDCLDDSYPIVQCSTGKKYSVSLPIQHRIQIKQHNTDAALKEVLRRYSNAEMILWIENSVNEATTIYNQLSKSIPEIDLGLLHSRFTAGDRQVNEKHWINIFGKDGDRSRGRVLVGTQVLEQSIDIDADFLVTRLCPLDMLFQRMGRLQRHKKNNPSRKCDDTSCWVLNPVPKPDLPFGVTQLVYNQFTLASTLENLPASVEFPTEIRPLMELVYQQPDKGHPLRMAFDQMIFRNRELEIRGLDATTDTAMHVDEEIGSSRLDGRPSTGLILIDDLVKLPDGHRILFRDGTSFDVLNQPKKNHPNFFLLVKKIVENTVLVPSNKAPAFDSSVTPWLKEYVYQGDKDRLKEDFPKNRIVKVQNGFLVELNGNKLKHRYTPSKGFH